MESAISFENVFRVFPALYGIGGIVAAVYSKDVFVIVPRFTYHAAGVRKGLALLFGLPLAAGKNHYRDVLIGVAGAPLRISEDNNRAMPFLYNLVLSG